MSALGFVVFALGVALPIGAIVFVVAYRRVKTSAPPTTIKSVDWAKDHDVHTEGFPPPSPGTKKS